jgi:heptaprenylglyceryl phosphate synthase
LTRELSLICWRFVNVFDDIDDIFVFSLLNSKSFFFIQIHFVWIRFYIDLQSVNSAKHLR